MVCKAKKRTDCRQLHFVQTEEKAARVQAEKRGKGRARAALHLKKEKILQKKDDSFKKGAETPGQCVAASSLLLRVLGDMAARARRQDGGSCSKTGGGA